MGDEVFESSLADGEVLEFFDEGESTPPNVESTITHDPRSVPPLPERRPASASTTQVEVSTIKKRPTISDMGSKRVIEYEFEVEEEEEVTTSKTQRKKTAKLGKRKIQRAKQFTERDATVIKHLDSLGMATLNHIAFLVGVSPKSIQRRLRQLHQRGYVNIDDSENMLIYSPTTKGLAIAGVVGGSVQNQVARSTYAHRNKISSIVTFFSIGANQFSAMEREVIAEMNRKTEVSNQRTDEYNIMLAESQRMISQKSVEHQSLAEQRLMMRKPRNHGELKELPRLLAGDDGFSSMPNLVFAERLIQRSISSMPEAEGADEWKQKCSEILNDSRFPVLNRGFERNSTEEEIQLMNEVISTDLWAYRHWNTDGSFAKRHMPDGVLVKPNVRNQDGSLSAGSWWIEMEESRKPNIADVVRCILQAIEHPLVAGVLYFTNDQSIANYIKKAQAQASTQLSYELMKQGLSADTAYAQAQAIVANAVRIKRCPLVNPHQKTGFWG